MYVCPVGCIQHACFLLFTGKSAAEETEKQLSNNGSFESSSVDLYNNMVLAEQELENLRGNVDDDDVNDDKKASLLSMMTTTNTGNLQCISCTGVLPPTWLNNHVNEQSYCFPDGGSNQMMCSRVSI